MIGPVAPRPWLDQQTNNRGSQSLGTHSLRGRVRIEVRDTRARDNHRHVDLVNASLPVDAIRRGKFIANGKTTQFHYASRRQRDENQ